MMIFLRVSNVAFPCTCGAPMRNTSVTALDEWLMESRMPLPGAGWLVRGKGSRDLVWGGAVPGTRSLL